MLVCLLNALPDWLLRLDQAYEAVRINLELRVLNFWYGDIGDALLLSHESLVFFK